MNIRVTCYNNSFDYRHCQSCGDSCDCESVSSNEDSNLMTSTTGFVYILFMTTVT